MSFFESGPARFTWDAQALLSSTETELGCVQCGSRLDPFQMGKFALTGKCFNCVAYVTDGDDEFDDDEF